MPIPTPKPNEDKQKFTARCMGDETMKKDYKNTQQRLAICLGQTRKNKASILDQFENKMGDIRIDDKEKIANQLYYSIMPSDKFAPGHIARRYWARRPENNQEPNFKDATTYSYRPLGFDTSQVPEIAYKQSSEDEEELGNIMSDKIGQYIASGEKIEDVKTIVDEIMNKIGRASCRERVYVLV